MALSTAPQAGELVRVRSRSFVVSDVAASQLVPDPLRTPDTPAQHLVQLSSVDDDAYGEELSVIWELEPGAEILENALLPTPSSFDPPERLDAFLDAVRWAAIESADSRALQAPFRSGIKIEDEQLDPVARAIEMPRVNLLIADDVGFGKTIEAGLVAQELILRHKARRILIVCPASLQIKWRDEMHQKFGLDFQIVYTELMRELRRKRGIRINPWNHFPRLITSIDLEQYLADRDLSEGPRVIWLDFTGPASESNLELTASTVRELQSLSIVEVTFNASGPRIERNAGEGLAEFDRRRVEEAVAALGRYAPASLDAADLSRRRFGQIVLDSIERALDAEMTGSARTYVGTNALQYADGAPIVSATMIPCDSSDELISSTQLDRWEFFQPDWPKLQLIDMPELSSFERIHVDRLLAATSSMGDPEPSDAGPAGTLQKGEEGGEPPIDTRLDGGTDDAQFEMPSGSLGGRQAVLDSFTKFSRLYPHFARIEL